MEFKFSIDKTQIYYLDVVNGEEERNPKVNLYFFEVANINLDPNIVALPK